MCLIELILEDLRVVREDGKKYFAELVGYKP